jgi:hypothetical protein
VDVRGKLAGPKDVSRRRILTDDEPAARWARLVIIAQTSIGTVMVAIIIATVIVIVIVIWIWIVSSGHCVIVVIAAFVVIGVFIIFTLTLPVVIVIIIRLIVVMIVWGVLVIATVVVVVIFLIITIILVIIVVMIAIVLVSVRAAVDVGSVFRTRGSTVVSRASDSVSIAPNKRKVVGPEREARFVKVVNVSLGAPRFYSSPGIGKKHG